MSVVSAENPLSYVLGTENPVDLIEATRAPTASDNSQKRGSIWNDFVNQEAYILVAKTSTSATWKQIT